MLIVTGVGITCCVIFHVGLRETSHDDVNSATGDPQTRASSCAAVIAWHQWLTEPQFYIVRRCTA